MHRCQKKCVSLQCDLGDNKSWQNAYRISSFSRKSPVFDLTEGQMPMLFAYMCCNGTSIGIRHSGEVPSLLRSLAIPLLRRTGN